MMNKMFQSKYCGSRCMLSQLPPCASVDEGFDKHDIPYDVLWLDIEHTNGKQYMTWDTGKFPSPDVMQDKLAAKGRKVSPLVLTTCGT